MIFRNNNGELVDLNKYDFKNDLVFYKKIMEMKRSFTKLNKPDEIKKTSKKINYSNYIIQTNLSP
jgi:hypothetical protein